MNYEDLAAHRLMVRDEARTEAFREAIERTVTAGSVVLDLGAGTGILSLFAARAGAARVYAVERAATAAETAATLAADNGFGSVIRVVQGEVRGLHLPEPVDLIVSEWMGTVGIDENMYGAVLWAKDHWLKSGGTVLPAAVTAMAAPVSTAQRTDADFFAARPWGLDLRALAEPTLNELLMLRRRIDPADIAIRAQPLWSHVAVEDGADRVRRPEEAELSFVAERPAMVSALALWFEATLTDGVRLANGPTDPDTHWGQMLLPFDAPIALDAGDRLGVTVAAWPVGPGPLMFRWRWHINDGPACQRDTTGSLGAASPEAQFLPRRSALSRFFARLAADPEQLARFLTDPDAIMAEEALSAEHRDAILSRDQDRIGAALYDLRQPS